MTTLNDLPAAMAAAHAEAADPQPTAAGLAIAAPTLYRALKSAADELAEWDAKIRPLVPPGYVPRTATVLKEARAALALAEGRPISAAEHAAMEDIHGQAMTETDP